MFHKNSDRKLESEEALNKLQVNSKVMPWGCKRLAPGEFKKSEVEETCFCLSSKVLKAEQLSIVGYDPGIHMIPSHLDQDKTMVLHLHLNNIIP